MSPKHSKDFKREAVRIATHSGLTRRQVASDPRVGFSTRGKWMRDYSIDPTAAEDAELHRENERLRKENRILLEEREVLRKAAIFFATQKQRDFNSLPSIAEVFHAFICVVSCRFRTVGYGRGAADHLQPVSAET